MTETTENSRHKKGHMVYRRLDPFLYRRRQIKKIVLWTIAVLAFYTVVIANIGKMVDWFEPEVVATSKVSAQPDTSKPSSLITNAFKLGHVLTQMRFSETNAMQYIKWRNRTIVHLVALGIDNSVIHEAIDDSLLTLDETIVLRERIREKIAKLHGTKAAATFVVGVELIPVTEAFELHLRDNNYRNKLTKSDVSIFQIGSVLNAHLDEAAFPDDLKLDLVATYNKSYPQNTSETKLSRIRRFREEILNYFLEQE